MRIRGGPKQQDGRGPSRPGPQRSTKDAASRNDSPEHMRFEKFGNEIGDSHGPPAEQIEDPLLAEAAYASTSLEEIPEILGRGRINGGRCDRNKFANNAEKMIERFGKLCVFRCVFFRVSGNFGGSLGVVVIEEKRLAVGRGSKDPRIRAQNFAIEFMKLQVTCNVGAKRSDRVRKSRSVKPWMKFLGDGAAADHFAALQNERPETALCEIKRSDQSGVATADESYALADGHD